MFNILRITPSISKVLPRKAHENMSKPVLLGCSHLCSLNLKKKISYETVYNCGRVVERMWLTATKLGHAWQPWTVLPYFVIRVKFYKGVGFSEKESMEILEVERDFKKQLNIKKDETPFFIFRLSKSKTKRFR